MKDCKQVVGAHPISFILNKHFYKRPIINSKLDEQLSIFYYENYCY